jgi:hypothetical protein
MQPVYQSQRQSADKAARTASQQPAASLVIRNPHTAPHSHSGLLRSLRPSQVPIDSSEWPHPRSDQHQQEAEGRAQGAPVASRDFTKIPVFPPDRPNRPHASSPSAAPVLPGSTHTNLAIGRVDDPLEHEAEHVAEQVIRMPDPGGEEGAAAPLRAGQARSAEVAGDELPGLVHKVLRSPGQPLDPGTRAFFEPRLGHDFSSVRVHTDAAAAASAHAGRALAYTAGRDLVFAEGRYAPHGDAGRRLLAHELTHTVQQGAIAGLGPTGRSANGSAANGILVQRQPDESAPSQAAVKGAQDDTLGGHQLFQKWFQYWIGLLNAAADREKLVRTALGKADKVSYANNMDLFQNGKRDALGPDYQDAADRWDAANYMLSAQTRLLNWLEDWVDSAHHHVTFKQVNEKALEIAKAQARFETWFAPIIFGILGGVLNQPLRGPGPKPILPSQPPPGAEPILPSQPPPGAEPILPSQPPPGATAGVPPLGELPLATRRPISRIPSEPETTAAPAATLGIRERLIGYYQRLSAKPAARTADDGLRQVSDTLDEVEDQFSGVPKRSPPPPPGENDGRMYPPLSDNITRQADGSIIARTRGHRINIGSDGSITITNFKTGEVEFKKP